MPTHLRELCALGVLCAAMSCGNLQRGYVPIARGAHPLALPQFDVGPLSPERRLENLSLVFKLSPEQEQAREALLAAQLDPASPSYRQWLTPEEYAARFGARAADIERAQAWLTSEGLEVLDTSRLGARVRFGGTVAQIQTAFHASIRQYQIGDELHYAMPTAPMIPAELTDVVLAVQNTHDFYPRPQILRSPNYQSGGTNGLGPPDWSTIYDVTALYTTGIGGRPIDGTGVTIAVVGLAQVDQGDIDTFRTTFSLPPSTVTMTLVPNTGAAQPGSGGAGAEAFLDLEWSGGIAKGSTINYVFTGANDGNVDDATFYAIENNLAPVLSESFGGCESQLAPSDVDVLQTFGEAANLLGITYLAASGDTGAASCIALPAPLGGGGLYTEVPAAYPGVTAVGGTEFPTGSLTYDANHNVTGYSNLEQTWNESNTPPTAVAAGGGGISVIFNRPSYQLGVPTCPIVGTIPRGVDPTKMRMVPDVALTAAGTVQSGTTVQNNPYFIYCTVDFASLDCSPAGTFPLFLPVAGTSASTPSFAGVVALINQATGGRLGNINPLLYQLAASVPSAFHDIKLANNEVKCTPGTDPGCPASGVYGFPAAAGYDCATGLGSIDAKNLVTAWASLAPTSAAVVANPSSTTEGASVQLTATVTVPVPNASALTGTVTFVFESYDATGKVDLSWVLGSAPITGATTAQGTATLTGPIPPGLVKPGMQSVDVVALYGGDSHHLASTSAKFQVSFGPLSFCISPAAATLPPDSGLQFISMNGTTPVHWFINTDTTCNATGTVCSAIDPDSGVFTSGPQPGNVLVFGLDNFGAEGTAQITVSLTDAGITLGCGLTPDAGTDAGSSVDAGGGTDAGGVADAGTPSDAGRASDAGSFTDAGSSTDAGTSTDAGVGSDAGATRDAGATADAGGGNDAGSSGSDAGTSRDGGATADAGPTGGNDGGVAADAGTGGGGKTGCGCTTDPSASTGLFGLALIAFRATRRKRR